MVSLNLHVTFCVTVAATTRQTCFASHATNVFCKNILDESGRFGECAVFAEVDLLLPVTRIKVASEIVLDE